MGLAGDSENGIRKIEEEEQRVTEAAGGQLTVVGAANTLWVQPTHFGSAES
jgi:hypothetical protein